MSQRIRPAPPERPKPLVSAREERDQAMLGASRAVLELFLRERTSDFSVRELAAHAGLSERTFYRYFPRKEDAIRPAVDASLARIAADMRAAPRGKSVGEALVAAYSRVIAEESLMNWGDLLQVLNQTESLRAAWLQILTDAEVALAHAVAERLGISPDSQQARLAGAVLTTAGRLALEQPFSEGHSRDTIQVLTECLEMLGPTLFEKSPSDRESRSRSPPRRSREGRG